MSFSAALEEGHLYFEITLKNDFDVLKRPTDFSWSFAHFASVFCTNSSHQLFDWAGNP